MIELKREMLGDALDWSFIRKEFEQPFDDGEIKFRQGSYNKDLRITLSLAYIDSRELAARLNRVVGPENWSNAIEPYVLYQQEESEVPFYSPSGESVLVTKTVWENKKPVQREVPLKQIREVSYPTLKCTLTVLNVSKVDVGTPSNTDPAKGIVGDSFKRAAVMYGIGAYLYDLKGLEHPGSFDQLPDFAVPSPNYKSASKLIKEISEKIKASDQAEAKETLAKVQRTFDPGLAEIYKYRLYRILKESFVEV